MPIIGSIQKGRNIGLHAVSSKMELTDFFLKSVVSLNPEIFRISDWPSTELPDLKVFIYVYPEGTSTKRRPIPPSYRKRDVPRIIQIISGSERLTPNQFKADRGLIMYAVDSMRADLEKSTDNEEIDFFRSHLNKIDSAVDEDELLVAIIDLVAAIEDQ